MEEKENTIDTQTEIIDDEEMDAYLDKVLEMDAKAQNCEVYPMVALRGRVIFPSTYINFDVGREKSIKAIEETKNSGGMLFIATQKKLALDKPLRDDIYTVGVVVKVRQIIKTAGGHSLKVSVEAIKRAKIVSYIDDNTYFKVAVEELPYIPCDETYAEAGMRSAKQAFAKFALVNRAISKEMVATMSEMTDANTFMDNVLTVLPIPEDKKQALLEVSDTKERLEKFVTLLMNEIELSNAQKKIEDIVKKNIDKSQKEYYLREQLKAIHTELGDDEDEKEGLRTAVKDKKLPTESEEKVLKEIDRLDKINPSSPDYSIILNYLDWIKELPFNKFTKDCKDLSKAEKILNEDHFGLEKVKERIVEYLAVLHLTKQLKGPILCFVGPPGVGKTSIAKSIARATGRKFVRMSLGGVKDEAEIRGHRRTYVGAMPGRIIYALKQAGSANPVFLLDEIDKITSDMHGDPASALLEVLDPEQNSTFRDRFLEIPCDLSKVMFITTANSTDTIPAPLLDRMEVIRLSGYTDVEKVEIADKYLLPKALKENGLSDKKLELTRDGIVEIIDSYTLEAGVRSLERQIGSVVRKIAKGFALKQFSDKQIVDKNRVVELLGPNRKPKNLALEHDEVGACTGLAWTAYGGTTLTIEVGLMKGKGEVVLTGQLGDVMKESARAGITFIRANAEKFGIDESVFATTDIHVHVPEGATPKDGPSAGITIATAILSAFTKRSVKASVAMTGELTLRGKVLPIGGLKEKALAGFHAGVKTVIVPKDNEKDLEDIPEEIKKQLKFVPVSTIDEVFETALNKD